MDLADRSVSLQHPRRIFRSSLRPAPSRTGRVLRLGALGLLGVVAAGGLLGAGMSTELFIGASSGPAVLAAGPAEVAVVGGDTLRLHQVVVRLQGVEAPARGLACRGGAGEVDCGGQAASALADLVRGQRVACELHGSDRAGRRYGECRAGDLPLNAAIIAAGWARADGALPALAQAEGQARASGRGLWATIP
jgi:endonuclease YncB( thermonuclease family)